MAHNKVAHYQRLFQQENAHKPVWMRHPRSKMVVYPFYALFTVVCVGVPIYYGSRAIIFNKKAEKGKLF